MMLTKTQLPDKRNYESYDSEVERNIRLNQLRAQRKNPESWQYKSQNWWVYYVAYKD